MITYLILQLLLVAALFLFILVVMNKYQFLHGEMDRRTAYEDQEKSKKLIEAELVSREHTYKEVSIELHDSVSHTLAICKLQLENMRQTNMEELDRKVDEAGSLLSEAMSSLNFISRELDPSVIDRYGFLKALEMAVARMVSLDLFRVHFQVIGTPQSFGSNVELHLYRIFQEAFHNMLKHAEPTGAVITLTYSDTGLHCLIMDDGKGFDDKSSACNSGSGLSNMKKRASLIGATLEVSSIINNGTVITIHLLTSKTQ